MAAEEEKSRNLLRMTSLIIEGMAKTLYDMFGESALATMEQVGKDMLEIMEKEMGLELAGESPEDVLTEIGRLFEDEMGLIERFHLERNDKEISMGIDQCRAWDLDQRIKNHGVDIPFTCPVMNVGKGALRRLGMQAHRRIELKEDKPGCTIHFILRE